MSGAGAQFESGLVAPRGRWWRPAARQERLWVAIAFVWCLVLFAMMPFWHFKGGQNPAGVRTRVEPEAFAERMLRMVEEYQVGEDNGVPVVAPPPGSEVYLQAQMWAWYPVLQLEEGATYTLHVSSLDLNHGFSLYPANINLQVVPGYDYALTITPNQAGEYRVVCNEFCGVGHHLMLGRVVVQPRAALAALGSAAPQEGDLP